MHNLLPPPAGQSDLRSQRQQLVRAAEAARLLQPRARRAQRGRAALAALLLLARLRPLLLLLLAAGERLLKRGCAGWVEWDKREYLAVADLNHVVVRVVQEDLQAEAGAGTRI